MSVDYIELVNTNDVNYLGLKSEAQQKKDKQSFIYQYASLIFPSLKPSPWISEPASRRVKLMREAYLAVLKTRAEQHKSDQEPYTQLLELLSLGKLDYSPKQLSCLPINHEAHEIFTALKHESNLEFEQFVKTLTDAQPHGMVGRGKGRNPHLAEIITIFTYIYEQKPQNNPLLYAFSDGKTSNAKTGVTAQSMLKKGIRTKGSAGHREAVEQYMQKIESEIERLINMSDQEMGMTFGDDNVKHVAIVRKLKLAYNRLSAELDYGKRFVNVHSHELLAEDYEIVAIDNPINKKTAKKGNIYLMPSGQYYVLDPQGEFQEGLLTNADLQTEMPQASRRLLAKDYDIVSVEELPVNPVKHKIYKRGEGDYCEVGPSGQLRNLKVEIGKAYLLNSRREYAYLDSQGTLQTRFLDANYSVADLLREKDNIAFKSALLAITSSRGHTEQGDKTDNYRLEECDQFTAYDHEKVQSKISMRRKKKGILGTSVVFSILITIGQVAIAIFTATGIFAVLIGISCGITNIFLFARDIRGVLLSLIKGDLTRGLGWKSKAFLGLWFLASFATAIVAGGLVMLSLVSVFGFVISTAPAWLSIGAGIIAALTVIGMTSLFFQVGAGIAKSLRGQTIVSLAKSTWKGLKSFFTPPAFNKELQDLQDQVDDYEVVLRNLKQGLPRIGRSLAQQQEIEALREEYRPIRAHLRREKFAHYARFGSKLFFSVFFVPLGFVAAFVATYAFSILSASGTADTFKMVLGWSDKLATGVSNALTAISGVLNGALSAKNLFNVGLSFAAKIGKMTVGIVYGVATVVNLAYHGKLWQSIKNGFEAFRSNPLKTIIPSLRTGLAVAFGVAIALNGYGNGATAGGGAIDSYYLPQWLLKLVDSSTLTVILSTASSMALNKAAIDDAFKTDTPILSLENPKPAVVEKRKQPAFFDTKVRPQKAMRISEGDVTQTYSLFDDMSSSGSDNEIDMFAGKNGLETRSSGELEAVPLL